MNIAKSKLFFVSIVVFIPLVAAGCIRLNGPQSSIGGGVFKSVDGGESWNQKIQLLRIPEEENVLAETQTTVLVFDPQDSGTLYLGTKTKGAFVSFDGTDTWERVRNLESGSINAIAVHPRAKHIVYIAVDNQLFKSIDANRTWELTYIDATERAIITELAIDYSFPQRIYIGLSDGRIIKSDDDGVSWQALYDTGGRIKQIAIYPFDSQLLYVISNSQGIFHSVDGGETWSLKSKGLYGVEKLIFDFNNENTIISLTEQGLFKSSDRGNSWEEYTLLIPAAKLKVYAIALDPQDSNTLYYSAHSTLYVSEDNGEHWMTRPLPSQAAPKILLIDPISPHILYIGAGK